jgi:hypothetical protein
MTCRRITVIVRLWGDSCSTQFLCGLKKPGERNGFQQIIEHIEFKRIDGELRKSGCQYNARWIFEGFQ